MLFIVCGKLCMVFLKYVICIDIGFFLGGESYNLINYIFCCKKWYKMILGVGYEIICRMFGKIF